ncbi:DUF2184 domain-containing protein [Nguyenibacter vanlangensis]|uniref:DUF2184 domain-containing protein n=1 Tax=Nguyenibacter vanlangensis TaxID=1216886 RepID=A0A7Y7M5L0_9PROT|nr:DUF2184 domain-containing protein [Nguyenibacter vanlangensis]NVN09716.1 DUF2184 domain-containing protein [Nguyenibacter vanlangensis]
MTSSFRQDAPRLALDYGVILEGVRDYIPAGGIVMDADPGVGQFPSVTAPNSGVPFAFTQYVDPAVIKAFITPTRAAEVYGEAKKGDWITDTALFPVVSLTGRVAAYGDSSQDGTADANANWVNRQSFHYQIWTQWGEREIERMGAGKLDWVSQKNLGAASTLNKQQNLVYLFGISGLECYGALNDPRLPAAIQPTAKAGSSGTVTAWTDTSDPVAVYGDIIALFGQLNNQMMGVLTLETPLTLVLPTERQQALLYANSYNTTLRDLISKSLPNLKIETLPEAGIVMSGGTQTVCKMQMFVDTIEGQKSVTTAFTEKLRAHAVERYSSNFRQKKSQGTWGTIWFYPMACATMEGI